MGVPGTGPRRSCYSDTGMLAMPLSKVTEIFLKYRRFVARSSKKSCSVRARCSLVMGRGVRVGAESPQLLGDSRGRVALSSQRSRRKKDREERAG